MYLYSTEISNYIRKTDEEAIKKNNRPPDRLYDEFMRCVRPRDRPRSF